MTTYICSLHFGTLEIWGIEADGEMEARQKAMNCFRPALLGIDERNIEVKAQEKEITSVIKDPRIKLKTSGKKHARRFTTTEICKRIGKMAEVEGRI